MTVGGTFFIRAGGLTKLLNDKLQVPGNVASTGGPVHNIQLTEVKKLGFGMVTNGPSCEVWNGDGLTKGGKINPLVDEAGISAYPMPEQHIYNEERDQTEAEYTFHLKPFSHDFVDLKMIDHLVTKRGERSRPTP